MYRQINGVHVQQGGFYKLQYMEHGTGSNQNE